MPLFIKKGEEVIIQQSHGMLLGFAEDSSYTDYEYEIDKNGKLFLITDGVLEAQNKASELLGAEQFVNFIKEINDDSNPVEVLQSKLAEYTNNRFTDDISLISISAR